jgi:tetratricopeptide (TPR) repeat protein
LRPFHACRAADCQTQWGDFHGARDTLTAAAQRFPSCWGIFRRLGQVLAQTFEPEKAQASFQRAIELAPTLPVRVHCMFRLADFLQSLGRKAEAISVLRNVLELMPHETTAYWGLVESDNQLDSASDVARTLIDLSGSSLLQTEQRPALHYALGHLYDRSRRSAEAFTHFLLANDLRARQVAQPPPSKLRREVDGRSQVFTKERISTLARYGSDDESLVFIVGMPRSGTTLVEHILSSHSAACGLGERPDVIGLTQTLRWRLRSRKNYPWCIDSLTPKIVRAVSQAIVDQRRRDGGGAMRIISKMPEDFWDLGLIGILFPRARIIHCRRHAIDTCLSCFMQYFENLAYTTNLTHLADVYGEYRRIMKHWRAVLPELAMLDVSYEEVVAQPLHLITELCDFCGLHFEEACVRFHETERWVNTASRCQVRRPLYEASVARWERYREFLGPLLALEPE